MSPYNGTKSHSSGTGTYSTSLYYSYSSSLITLSQYYLSYLNSLSTISSNTGSHSPGYTYV
jgi:hypothetical protein